MLYRTCLLSLLLFCLQKGFGQSDDFLKIEKEILAAHNLSDAKDSLTAMYSRLYAGRQFLQAGRCLNDLIQISDIRTQDSLYFKNSAILDSLLLSEKDSLFLCVLHFMQANRLETFLQNSSWSQYRKRFFLRKDIPVNYAVLDNDSLRELADYHFSLSRKLLPQLAIPGIEDALWLSPAAAAILFKPSLYDLLIHQQIVKSALRFPVGWQQQKDLIISLPENKFTQMLDTVQTPGTMKLYAEWLHHHDQHNPEAFYFIATQARLVFFNSSSYTTVPDSVYQRYESWLLQNTGSAYTSVKALSVCFLYKYWKEKGDNYRKHYYYGYPGQLGKDYFYNPQNRYYYILANDLLTQNLALLDSFALLKNELVMTRDQILIPTANLTVNRDVIPGKPILAALTWSNLEKITIRVIRVNAERPYPAALLYDSVITGLPVAASRQISLGNMASDFQQHSTYVKIDPLPAGRYLLVLTDSSAGATPHIYDRLVINVTKLAVVYDERRVFILDRTTGLPKTGAKALVYKKELVPGKQTMVVTDSTAYKVNTHGYFTIPRWEEAAIVVIDNTDTTMDNFDISDAYESETGTFNKDDYDDIIEYYEDHTKLYIFTDRSIYRPGQKVHFKGLFTTSDPRTGETVLFNRETLKLPLFKRLFDKELRTTLLSKHFPFYLNDPFGRAQDTISLSINEYGSVAGSFQLPAAAAPGTWDISVDEDITSNLGSSRGERFIVEAYKRPQYEVSIETPRQILMPNDSFYFRVKLHSFAGVPLSNVAVTYEISRWNTLYFGNLPMTRNQPFNRESVITQQTGRSNEKGELLIPVADTTVLITESDGSLSYFTRYTLSITATDASGETHEQTAKAEISNLPVNIYLRNQAQADMANAIPFTISTKVNGARGSGNTIRLRFFSNVPPARKYSPDPFIPADTSIYPGAALEEWFPETAFNYEPLQDPKRNGIEVLDTVVTCDGIMKFMLAPGRLRPGMYTIEATCLYKGKTVGMREGKITIYDLANNNSPKTDWHYGLNTSINPGDTIIYHSNFPDNSRYIIYQLKYFIKDEKGTREQLLYQYSYQPAGICNFEFVTPDDCIDKLQLTEIFLYNNKLYKNTTSYSIFPALQASPEIIIEKFRSVLTPGKPETFSVSVKTANENIAAELLTTLYDASLDKLNDHYWDTPYPGIRRSLSNNWPDKINWDASHISPLLSRPVLQLPPVISSPDSKPLWWMNPLDAGNDAAMGFYFKSNSTAAAMLAGKAAGVSISTETSYKEVVVTTALNVSSKAGLMPLKIRGSSLVANSLPTLIILDGEIYDGDLSKLNMETITDGLILKAAEATAIYGQRGENGVILLSTRGPVKQPAPAPPPVQPRRDFNETAFFFPQLHADVNGYYTFSFTMPESVTTWKWKLLAHTKELQFASKELTLQTNLPLMVQPNMPRVIYQGDKMILQSRISNLDSLTVSGQITCRIEDAVTGEDITGQLLTTARKDFSVAAHSNVNAGFELQIPPTQENPLKVIVVAQSGSASDGEEHLLPVLNRKIFSILTQPFQTELTGDSSILLPALPANATPFGIGINITAHPKAAWLQALRYITGYGFNCAEQTFNKMLGHLLANEALEKDSLFKNIAAVRENKDTGKLAITLPETLPASAVPWLTLPDQTELNRRQNSVLFHKQANEKKTDEYFTELKRMQNADGGIAWFSQGESDPYISFYILQSLGAAERQQLVHLYSYRQTDYENFVRKLSDYCDSRFEKGLYSISDTIQFLHARTSWQKLHPLHFGQEQLDSIFFNAWKQEGNLPTQTQAGLIIATLQYSKPGAALYLKAEKALQSLRQEAISDTTDGIRWKRLLQDDELMHDEEETIANLLDAFTLAGMGKDMNRGVLQWLLAHANDQFSRTTKSAAAFARACLYPGAPNPSPQTIQLRWADNNLVVSNNMSGETDFEFTKTGNRFPSNPVIHKTSIGTAKGNILYYFFSNTPPANDTSSGIFINRRLYKWNRTDQKWELLSAATVLAPGDRLKTTIELNCNKKLSYIMITDKLAACQEPVEYSSGYASGDRISYYQSGYDDGIRFFASQVPAGYSAISYETVITQQGKFFTGIPQLQGMYNPEINVYGNGNTIIVK